MDAADAFEHIPAELDTIDALSQGALDVELDACPCCASRLVQPLDWGPTPDERWRVERRCPECEWHGAGVYSQDVVDRYDEALDAGTDRLVMDLRLTVRANMLERMTSFIDALHADRILPEDF